MCFIRQMNVVEKSRLSAEHLLILQPGDRMADKRADAVGKLIKKIHAHVLRDPRKTDNSRQIIVMTSPPPCPSDTRRLPVRAIYDDPPVIATVIGHMDEILAQPGVIKSIRDCSFGPDPLGVPGDPARHF